jgi:hypothetical protein
MTRGSVIAVLIGAPSFDAPAGQGRWRASVADGSKTGKGSYPRTRNLVVGNRLVVTT